MNARIQKAVVLNLAILGLFALAFGLLEAIVVVYLRKIFGIGQTFASTHPKILLNLGFIAFLEPNVPVLPNAFITKLELFRETTTIIMLASVAYLSSKNLKRRIGAFLYLFSVWDLFYYVFLRLLTGWPQSLFDIDVFFLIPVAWVGPVITPIAISSVLLAIGVYWYIQPVSKRVRH